MVVWLIGWLVAWLIGRLVDWLKVALPDRLIVSEAGTTSILRAAENVEAKFSAHLVGRSPLPSQSGLISSNIEEHPSVDSMESTALHCTALHCTALYCTALRLSGAVRV